MRAHDMQTPCMHAHLEHGHIHANWLGAPCDVPCAGVQDLRAIRPGSQDLIR